MFDRGLSAGVGWWQMNVVKISGLLVVGLLVGCASKMELIPEVTPAMSAKYEVEEVTLARGRGIYMAHCATCHERLTPGKLDPEYWREITPHMALNAKLNDREEKELLQYVMVAHAEVHGLE